jgi:hypothetical protein
MDPTGTDDLVRRRNEAFDPSSPALGSRSAPSRDRRASQDLFSDPAFDALLDLNSTYGQREHAKKKKKPGSTPLNLNDNNNNEKKDDAAGDGNGGNGDLGGGASGDAGGGAGDGGSGGNGDGGGKADEDWATFGGSKGKNKGAPQIGGLPDIPTSDFGTDAFQEIKLGDDSGGKFDLHAGSTSINTRGAGNWGNKWNGGGSTWDWAGGGGDSGGGGTSNGAANPWGSKPKEQSSFAFGSKKENKGGEQSPRKPTTGNMV